MDFISLSSYDDMVLVGGGTPSTVVRIFEVYHQSCIARDATSTRFHLTSPQRTGRMGRRRFVRTGAAPPAEWMLT